MTMLEVDARSIACGMCSMLEHARTHARTYVDFGHPENSSCVSNAHRGWQEFRSEGEVFDSLRFVASGYPQAVQP